jgi:hypothetical protein
VMFAFREKIIALILGKGIPGGLKNLWLFIWFSVFSKVYSDEIKTEKYFEQDKIAVFSEKLEVLLLDLTN